jgi:putative transposase
MTSDKKNSISNSLKATRVKRVHQDCKVFEVKIDYSHLSKSTRENLKRLFLEAKWLYNYALAQENCFAVSDKTEKLQVKVKDIFEDRELKIISSQMKQSVLNGLQQNIVNLSKAKKKNIKVGRLKFISGYDSIELKQFGNTYRIKNDKRIKIQGIKQEIRVRGLEQIKGYECANAKLIRKASGYYLKITCYRDKQEKIINKKQVGIDLGILNQITLSNGIEIKYQVPVAAKKLRRLSRRLSHKEEHKSNWYKSKRKLNKQYEQYNNQKSDIKNKLLNVLKTEFGLIAYQNDCLRGWQRIWGKRMLNTAIGGITAELKKLPTSVEVDRFFASTKECPVCQHRQNIGLAERIFKCDNCGFEKHRDWKSADCILGDCQRTCRLNYFF